MYRKEWSARGLPDYSASASAAPPPPAHCARVYHLCAARDALENIEKSRLKVCTFKDTNDPFELSVFFSKES